MSRQTTTVQHDSARSFHSKRPLWWNKQTLIGVLFVAPLMLWLVAAIFIPLISAIRISFLDVGIIGTGGDFVGLKNYSRVLTSDKFWSGFGKSLVWVIVNALIQTFAAFATALVLNQPFRGRGLARIWIILSWIVPTVVVVIIWRWLLGTSGGVVNYLLVELGLTAEPIGFFSSGNTAFMSVSFINSWRFFPLMAVILLAGLQGIPRELYEAAAVDGALPRQQLRYITLPALQPVLFVLGLVGTLWSINVFDVIWLLTRGGPTNATTTLPVLIYDTAFNGYRLSRSAAMSVVTGLILLAFAMAFIRFMAPPSDEEQAQ